VDLLYRLLREGPSVGLHLVISADRSGMVGRISSMVEEKLLLRMADKGDYAGAGLPTKLVPADLPPGRGWSMRGAPLVAQVVLLDADASGPAQAAALAALAAAAPAPVLHRPRRVEVLPPVISLSSLPRASSPRSVVLGVGGDELDPVEVDLAETPFLVGGPPASGRSSTLMTVALGLRDALPVVAVAPRRSPLRELDWLAACITDREASSALEAALAAGPCALLVDDAELLVDSGLSYVLERAVREARDAGTVVVVAGTTDELVTGYRGFVVDVRKAKAGVLLSPQGPGDGDLLGARLSRATGGEVQPGRGLLVLRGRAEPVQVARPG
jgi:S-DNA-T family DNA segregation ATPase FtsK/SpoIIIE